jgi:hypothetical protein
MIWLGASGWEIIFGVMNAGGGDRFGQRRDMVLDGYRDVSVSVLYTHPSSNLSIIGEIQV